MASVGEPLQILESGTGNGIPRRGWLRGAQQFVLASAGVGCVGLAYIGALLPGMPTTIFLIMACFFFTRSCPVLEQRLIRNRFFGRFHHYLDRPTQMPMRARIVALSAMWISASVSAVVLASAGTSWWAPLLVIGLAVIGTVVILAMGRWRIAINWTAAHPAVPSDSSS